MNPRIGGILIIVIMAMMNSHLDIQYFLLNSCLIHTKYIYMYRYIYKHSVSIIMQKLHKHTSNLHYRRCSLYPCLWWYGNMEVFQLYMYIVSGLPALSLSTMQAHGWDSRCGFGKTCIYMYCQLRRSFGSIWGHFKPCLIQRRFPKDVHLIRLV